MQIAHSYVIVCNWLDVCPKDGNVTQYGIKSRCHWTFITYGIPTQSINLGCSYLRLNKHHSDKIYLVT